MKTLLTLTAAVVMITGPAVAQEYSEATAKARCEAEWPGDFQMIRFCLDQQTSAAARLDGLVPQLDDVMIQRYDICAGEWGPDFQMRAFCLDQQISARNSLPNTLSAAPSDVADGILNRCEGEWGQDFLMLNFCVETQIDAWTSLNN